MENLKLRRLGRLDGKGVHIATSVQSDSIAIRPIVNFILAVINLSVSRERCESRKECQRRKNVSGERSCFSVSFFRGSIQRKDSSIMSKSQETWYVR